MDAKLPAPDIEADKPNDKDAASGASAAPQNRDRRPPDQPPPTQTLQGRPAMAATAGGHTEVSVQSFQLPIGRGATVVLSVPVPMTPDSFKLVKQWLALMEPALTDNNPQQRND